MFKNYGVSTMTVVAFTIATPILPTSSPSSRTASVLINETTVKPTLHFDLGHHLVGDDLGDEAGEPVAGRTRTRERIGRCGSGVGPGEASQLGTVDDLAAGVVRRRGEKPTVDPPPDVSSLTPSRPAASRIRMLGTR